jgi:squalene-hopene/tetraprenyl-beta-curcumene cyclase
MKPIFFVVTLLTAYPAFAEQLGPDADTYNSVIARGVSFLKTAQADDGSWTAPDQVGITALVTTSLLDSGVPVDDPTIVKAMTYLESYVQEDGGVYHPESRHKNYESSIAVLAFEAANVAGRYDETLANAVAYLKGLQWDASKDVPESDLAFGGAGYGSSSRPDLSNTQYFLDALAVAGVPSDDPAVQNALVFVSRCQNLESEHNTTPFAASVNDGGFYYTPADGGSSAAGETPEGGLRSYASMTYAGLKSMIYAGLTPDDPRVAAATEWIRMFYSVSENPGLGQQGLFYYFHTFAKTLDIAGYEMFSDSRGQEHDWRKELAEQIFSLQREDGSWTNEADRWYEGDASLGTAYCLLALRHCAPIETEE